MYLYMIVYLHSDSNQDSFISKKAHFHAIIQQNDWSQSDTLSNS